MGATAVIPTIIRKSFANTNGFIIIFKSLIISVPQDVLPKVRNSGANLWLSDVIMLQCSKLVRKARVGNTISSQSCFRGAVVELSIISNHLVWWINFFSLLVVFADSWGSDFNTKAKLSQGMKWSAFPLTCSKRCLGFKRGDNYWKK